MNIALLRISLSILLLVTCQLGFAQEEKKVEEARFIYKKEWSGGGTISNRGFGGIIRYAMITNNFKKIIVEAEIVKVKHPKEIKVVNPYYDDSKSYVYGKQNVYYPLRIGAGTQFLIFDKAPKDGVEISVSIMGGASIGLLKPIYLDILKDNGNPYSLDLVSEKFDKDKHNPSNIFGYSGFNKGVGETTAMLGGYLKTGFNFDWSDKDDKILMLETGVVIDFYANDIPIMATFSESSNKPAYISLYASILFGKKY